MAKYFVGRDVDMTSAIDSADAIVVAELIDSGQADPGPPGQAYHYGAKIDVVRDLSESNLSGEQAVTFSVQRLPEDIAEGTPVVGDTYMFFLQRQSDTDLHAVKILPATSKNIQRIERLRK